MSRLRHATRTLLRLAALVVTVGLVLADSADDHVCAQSTFTHTYDVTTDCGGAHTGRIRLSYVGKEWSVTFNPSTIEHLSGDLVIGGAYLEGNCKANEVASWEQLTLTLGFAPGSPEAARCDVLLPGGLGSEVPCYGTNQADACMVRLVEVP